MNARRFHRMLRRFHAKRRRAAELAWWESMRGLQWPVNGACVVMLQCDRRYFFEGQ